MDACSTLCCTDTGQKTRQRLLLLSRPNVKPHFKLTQPRPVLFFRPDLIDMEVVSRQSNRENLEQAFEIAESLGVTRLLDAEGQAVNLHCVEISVLFLESMHF